MNLSDAAEWAEVAMILTPDELQATFIKIILNKELRQEQV